MRQAYWDELTLDEMALVNGRDAATQQIRLAEALARFAARLPAAEATDPEAAMRRIHPGQHRRGGRLLNEDTDTQDSAPKNW